MQSNERYSAAMPMVKKRNKVGRKVIRETNNDYSTVPLEPYPCMNDQTNGRRDETRNVRG